MKKTLICLFSIVFICPSLVRAGNVVTAKGLSFYEPGREVVAREKALDEAKRAAVEKAVGTSIQSNTVVENFQVVKDQILSRASGYLKDLKILEEKKSALGSYEITIEADVEIAALVDDLDRFQKILSWQKNPRISIVIDPNLNKNYWPTANKTANLLTDKLKNTGLSVFKYAKDNPLQMGLLVGLSLEVASKHTKYQDLEITLNEVSLSANIYRPGDGEILAAANAVKSLPGENSLKALDKGAISCVDAIWKNLRQKLLAVWEKELFSEREIYLIVKAVPSHAVAQETAVIFKSDVSGILSSTLIRFSKNSAEYHLKYRGWPEQFADEIQMSYFNKKYFKSQMEDISNNRITIKRID
ncbi:MAG: hypothetical protein Q8P24_18605 [Desulfobacterales bacterium]|nr:hypothetical protein [Desulfobacterales bacterium]